MKTLKPTAPIQRNTNRIKRLLFGILAGLLGTMVALGIGEIGVRMVLPPPLQVTVKPSTSLKERLQAERAQPASLSASHNITSAYVMTDTGMRMRANLQITVERQSLSQRRILIQTNSLGYRNPEIGEKKGTRFLFLGDSITVNEALPDEENFVRLIENKALTDRLRWETVNAAVTGISTQNQLAILHETGLSTDPDVVVIGFYLNDFQESPGVFVPKLPYGLEKSALIYHTAKTVSFLMAEYTWSRKYVSRTWSRLIRSSLLENYPPGEGDFLTDPKAFNGLIWQNASDWGGAWSDHAWEIWKPLFAEFKRLGEKHGFKPAVVAFPVRYQVEADYMYDAPQQRLKTILDVLDVPMLDVLPLLRKAYREQDDALFFDHCHHTAIANRLIADEIYAFLQTAFPFYTLTAL